MADVWLTPGALVNLLGVSKMAISKAIASKKYTVREVLGGRGGKGGVRYEVLLASLPDTAKAAYQAQQEARLESKVAEILTAEPPASNALAVPSTGETLPAEKPLAESRKALPPAQWRDKDRAEATAKAYLAQRAIQLASELELSDTKACGLLLEQLNAETGPAELRAMARQALRGSRGNSLRSLQRFVSAYRAGQAQGSGFAGLVPGRRMKADWHGVPWGAAVLSAYRRPQRPTLKAAWREALKTLSRAGFAEADLPGYDSVRLWLGKVPVQVRERGRMTGSDLKKLLPHKRRDWSWMNSNDVWVGDGHTFKAKVRHPIHGKAFAPEVTVVMDCASRFIVGWAISLAENKVAVGEAIGKGLIAHGRPLIYYSDNGAGQTAKTLDHEVTGILARYGISHETGIPGNPQGRGIIERLWQTTLIPLAKTYKSYQGKDMDSLSLKRVASEIDKAERRGEVPDWLTSWGQFFMDVDACVKAYNCEHAHSALDGATPAKVYMAKLAPDSVMALTGPEALDVFRPEELRKVSRGEVNLFKNIYADKALKEWNGQQVRVRYDLADASQVWVYDIEGRMICTAGFDANLVDGFAKSVLDQLAEERVENVLKKVAEKERVARLELTRTLDAEAWHEADSRLVLEGEAVLLAEGGKSAVQRKREAEAEKRRQELAEAEAVLAESATDAEIPADEVPAVGGGVVPIRPTFKEDDELLSWLGENPEAMTEDDWEWMRERARDSRTFAKMAQGLFGAKATAA